MSFLEKILVELEQIKTQRQLERYLIQFTELSHIDWCCFIVHRCNIAYIGELPANVKQQLTLPALKQLSQACCKPAWSGSDELVKGILPQTSLLVPVVSSRPDYACLILGFATQRVEQKVVERLGWFWQLIAIYIYDTYRRINGDGSAGQVQLTQREIECVHWTARGCSIFCVSQVTGLYEHPTGLRSG